MSEETKRKISGFKKGVPSWNKGLKIALSHPQMGFQKGDGKLGYHEKSKMTQFKKGQHPSLKTEFQKGCISWNKGKEYIAIKGENHPNWKGGLLFRKKQNRRGDPAYHSWRIVVYIRDGFKCRIDNKDCNGKIEAHHILGWSSYPELRYEVKNGITLCRAHHPRKRAEEQRLISEFQKLVTA